MEAITGIRNSLVHPDAGAKSSDSYYEAYNLSLWYLDLILLHLCGHNGSFANRLIPALGGYSRIGPVGEKGCREQMSHHNGRGQDRDRLTT